MRLIAHLFTGLVAASGIALAAPASATLLDRGGGMVYDDVQNITWLKNANQGVGSIWDNGSNPNDGRMTWANAVAWAGLLVHGGYSDWRLPTTLQPDLSCQHQFPGSSHGYDCAGSEMGHLYHASLGAGDGVTILESPTTEIFDNVQEFFYWTATENFPDFNPDVSLSSWYFEAKYGYTHISNKSLDYFAWAVRDGDVVVPVEVNAPGGGPIVVVGVPEPASAILLAAGLMGLAGCARRRVRR